MNFNYNLPVNIIFGRGRVSEIGSEVLKYGKTALIVTGKTSTKKTGLLDRTIKLLNESDIKIIVEDVTKLLEKLRGSEQNTSSYEIMGAIINILKRDGFDEVISSYIGYKKE